MVFWGGVGVRCFGWYCGFCVVSGDCLVGWRVWVWCWFECGFVVSGDCFGQAFLVGYL